MTNSLKRVAAEPPFLGYWLYTVVNRERRKMALLVKEDYSSRTTISFARYLVSVREKRLLTKLEHVDHIDGNKENDALANLQILSQRENTRKSAKGRTMLQLVCPVCRIKFHREKRQVIGDPAKAKCSRRCVYVSLRKS